MFDNDFIKHGLEFARAIDNNQYEVSDQGVYFTKQRVFAAGQFTTWVNGADRQVDPNIVPAQGLALILKSGLNGTPMFVAPFLNNVTPLSTLTAATFVSVLAEFIAYDEAIRQAWTVPVDPVAGVYSNSAAPAVFTASAAVGTGAGVDIYGAALISASAKSSTAGTMACAAKFTGSRNVKTGDKLTAQYDISMTSV